jgi:carboxyl-terminal processing protease
MRILKFLENGAFSMLSNISLAIATLVLGAAVASAPITPVIAADDASNAKFSGDTYKYLELFGDVFERVRKDYVEDVSDQELLESAINGMLTSLDPHSGYMAAKRFEDMQEDTRGEFGGLGIEVTMEAGVVKVVSPIDDTPAARAGIESGDYIIAIDGEPAIGLALSEAVDKMRGPVNSPILVTIRRVGMEAFDVELIRAVITVQSVRSRVEGNKDVGYIRINTFTEQTQVGLERSVRKLNEEIGDDLKGYVLDLRNNPGGLLDQAVSVVDSFLDRGEIVSTRTRHSEQTQRYNARPGDLAGGKPIVVLINAGSASASEIVAGALQDHRRAIVLGTQSFGKGSVQTIIPLARGESAMRLTTARYYTPSGRSIQATGIAPDIEVQPATVQNLATPRFQRSEAGLRGSLRNEAVPDQPAATEAGGEEQDVDAPATAADDAEVPPEDYQLRRAVDLLQGIALYQRASLN